MDISKFINTKTIEALLDNRQDLLNGLLEASELLLGVKCPAGLHGEDVISSGNEDELYCEACDEVYHACAAACDKLHELGYYEAYAD